ncbi:hypothetical protein LDENG_00146410 [Lucifuga dentata]|nr:hypothetical protein LDENG_00146410 [Lucifuga dentata]
MKAFVFLAVITLIQGSYATLLIKGPTEPVLEGDSVTLECLYSDTELNITQVKMERFSPFLQNWHPIFDESSFMCRWASPMSLLERSEKHLFLVFRRISAHNQGTYRCVSKAENVTAPDNASQPLTLTVHYMREPTLQQEGIMRYLSVPQDLKVPLGDDVSVNCFASASEKPSYFWQKEGGDWVLPSSRLSLKKVSMSDGGRYTCVAKHPSVTSLSRRTTINITVLSEDALWCESSNGRLILITSAVAAALLVLILSMSIFLCRRAKKTKTSKGPIDDRSQKKPIYKTSVESLTSTSADKQPLV